MEKKLYRAIIIGTEKLDSNGNIAKDANGNPIIEFIKTARQPRAEFKNLAGRPPSKFVVVALFEDTKSTQTSADGEVMLLANEQRKPLVRAILDNRYPMLYPLLEQAVNDPKAHTKIIPTQLLAKVLIPGNIDTFATGFDYYVKRRNATTGVMEQVMNQKQNPVSGKIEEKPLIMNTITEFWYGNEVDNYEIMRKNAIEAHREDAHIAKPAGTKSDRDAEIEAAEAASAETEISAAAAQASQQIAAGNITQ